MYIHIQVDNIYWSLVILSPFARRLKSNENLWVHYKLHICPLPSLVWDFLLPLALTPDGRDHQLLVSSERHRQMLGEWNCLSFEMAVGGIEPPSPWLTVLHSTTRPLPDLCRMSLGRIACMTTWCCSPRCSNIDSGWRRAQQFSGKFAEMRLGRRFLATDGGRSNTRHQPAPMLTHEVWV